MGGLYFFFCYTLLCIYFNAAFVFVKLNFWNLYSTLYSHCQAMLMFVSYLIIVLFSDKGFTAIFFCQSISTFC